MQPFKMRDVSGNNVVAMMPGNDKDLIEGTVL
jgi:hypothetical protein